MMGGLKAFIGSNICSGGDGEGDSYDGRRVKNGVVDLDILLSCGPQTEVESSRLSYVWNLCLVDPQPFSISDEVSGLERACMMLSFGDYEHIDLSGYGFHHRLIGSVPTNDGVYGNSILVVECNGTKNRKEHGYSARGYSFDMKAESLTVEEQSILVVEMMVIFNTEVCQDLRRLKVQAYVDRVLFPLNERNEVIRMCALYHYMMLTSEPFLPRIEDVEVTDGIFEIPFVFLSDVEKQVGEAYYMCLAYENALRYFKKYRNSVRAIHCLVKLDRGEEAIEVATREVERVGEPTDHASRVRLSNINILLGSMTGNEAYFDTAFNTHSSYESLKAKGMYLSKRGEVTRAADAFEEALRISPQNTELLFLYATALTSSMRFREAAAVYEKLVADDRKNTVFLRNLAMCHLELKDVAGGLRSLKEASRYDQNMMQAYFLMSIKHNVPEEIIYSLERVGGFEDLEEGVMYLVESRTLDIEEVKSALMKNNRISDQLDSLLNKINKLRL